MNRKSIRFALLGALTMLATIVIFYVRCKEGEFQTARSWFVLGPLLLSELLLTLQFCGNIGKMDAKASPVRIAVSALLPIYFCFCLLMAAVAHSSITDSLLATIQVVVAILVLAFVVLTEMAGETIAANAVMTATANVARKDFRFTVNEIIENLKNRGEVYASLQGQCEQLNEAARFAADTVPGGEQFDEEVGEKLAEVERLSLDGTEASSEILATALGQALRAFRKREMMMKSLR